jgi:superfamily II DNA/RNA helicase
MAKDLLVDLLEQDEQVVVYARFLAEVAAVQEVLEKLGARSAAITGKVPAVHRAKLRGKFQRGSLDSLVFQVATGSLAINLSAAREILYYSLPDGWLDYYQSSKRTGEIGGRPTRIRHLVCPGTQDMAQLGALRVRADAHSELMRDARAFVFGA